MLYSRKAVLGSNPNPSAIRARLKPLDGPYRTFGERPKLRRLLRTTAHPVIEVAITVNGTAINLDWATILIWCLVGLVAGFLASRVALGHGLGLFGDIVVGILGAFLAGFITAVFHINVLVRGYPIIGEMVVAFVGAVILLMIVRLVSGSGRRRRRAT
jgi:uncharacterized membrane protein YeaQ/YmgE (transglycosylase-associated protein family)